MEAGMQYVADPGDQVATHMNTNWDIQKRADYEEERGPRQPVYSSRKTRRTAHDESENHQYAADPANCRTRP